MAEPKKVIFKVRVHDDKVKKKVMKAISTVQGINSINMDMKDKKLTVVGVFDPIHGYEKLKKVCETSLLVVDVVKKKEEPKKEEPKKEKPKKEDEKIKVWTYEPSSHHMPPCYYVTVEEYPTYSCVIS